MKIELYTRVALKVDFPEHGLKKGDTAYVIEHYSMPEGEEDGYSLEGFGIPIPGVTVEVKESQICPVTQKQETEPYGDLYQIRLS